MCCTAVFFRGVPLFLALLVVVVMVPLILFRTRLLLVVCVLLPGGYLVIVFRRLGCGI